MQADAYRFAWIAGLGTLALIGVVSLWTPLLNAQFMARWFAWPAMLYSAPVPILVALAALVLFDGLRKRRDARPFFAAIALFVLCYIGLGISFYPYIVPPSLTIWSAAAPDSSLGFLLVGAARSHPADPRLHGLVLLGVPRQGRRPRGLSLMADDAGLSTRLLWFVALWLAGVAAVALVALLIRTALH